MTESRGADAMSLELCALHSAVVAAGSSVMEMQILDAIIAKELPNVFFEFAPLHDVCTDHHSRRIIGANG